ncbi:primosomal protein N' [Humibacter ginsenosidimutans]|uniref:Probable replication restart protein PriA n=1 Tax=Humibacter ginsenosidimutans TaxID=2599293 RepID=A0A5B8M0P4_9MICO|nr:primosomal protein N' [Humibacter ginsenosidimutans]QDZ13826.1 primosomal protein N' [Humibacter ginsenosidimutans]
MPEARGPRVARVIVDTPLPQLDRLFDYAIPERLREQAVPGVRVTVPLRSAGRIADGYLVEVADDASFDGELSELDSVVSAAKVLTPEIARLARRIADRSAGSANDVLRLAVPPRMVRVEKAWLAAEHPAAPEEVPVRGVRGYRSALAEAIDTAGRVAVDAVPRLARTTAGEWVGAWAITLAELAARCVASGRSAVIAVPDYRDLDQLQAALRDAVPDHVLARVDAGQSNQDRYRAFLRCLEPSPVVVIGNRSAVYSPAHRLGLIALWDDSDPLHAEPLAPYAHARDVALVRAEDEGCALAFVSHTRSIEVQRLVELGWLTAHSPEPAVTPRVVVTAAQSGEQGPSRVPDGAWRAAKDGIAHGPVLVQVARPGYAPVLACATCRQAARCAKCQGPLGLDRAGAPPSCRWCGAIATGWECSHCGGTAVRLVTRGSARTAEELGRAFPGSRVIVSDGERRVTTIDERPALVVATRGAEPITPGGYRAVLLLDGDRMLARESLNVAEDCLRWWSNAASLAAPGAPVVLVGVAGPLAQALATWRQPAYASTQLADRRALKFPPAVRLASVTGTPKAVGDAVAALVAGTFIDVLGPTPVETRGAGRQGSGHPDAVRAIVRFDYAHGAAVASALRSAVVKAAAKGRKPRGDRGYRPPPTLRVRLDDPEIS